ncbi:MAG: hypothetical protein MUC99_09245 [Anaerolineae bacterium]|nr:hypothetical protein [Anaerolineae bacterium]
MSDNPNETFLYLTTRGRKTGNDNAHWVKNALHTPEVRFSVGTRADNGLTVPERTATARVVDDAAEPVLAANVRAKMQAKYDWSDGLIVEVG